VISIHRLVTIGTKDMFDHVRHPGQINNVGSTTNSSSERLPTQEEKFVDWTGTSDAENPFNWPQLKKWRVTLLACFMTFVVQISGTAMTSATEQMNRSFGISDEHFPHSYWPVLSWNLGGAAAPMLGLPLMENFGVRWTYLVQNT
jgi:hypothetical protein